MEYDIKLRPHHVRAFCKYVEGKNYLLSDEDFIRDFQERNKGKHDDQFVIFWKRFLESLKNEPNTIFLYINEYDEICNLCDLRDECEDEKSDLHSFVKMLHEKALQELSMKEGEIYTIQFLLDSLSKKI